MKSYFYQAPFVKSSTQKCEIIREEENEVIGSVQRYFNSAFHRLIDLIIGRGHLIVKVMAKDTENKVIIDAFTEMALFKRPNYYIHFVNGAWKDAQFQAVQTNNTKIEPEFCLNGNGIEIIIKQDMFVWVRFYEDGQEFY